MDNLQAKRYEKQFNLDNKMLIASVEYGNAVYDVTNFIFDHPGGEEFLLQYGGKDITNVMGDEREHLHSDAAYELLKDYYIGELDTLNRDTPAQQRLDYEDEKAKQKFVDPAKPMLLQVLYGGFSKEFYLKQVHIPRHVKGTPPLFGPAYLEIFSFTPWWVIPLFWLPIITYCSLDALKTISSPVFASLFVMGLFNWTLIEYTLHRFLFHLDYYLPDHPIALTIHFTLHGVHHFLPMDRLRLVMPPALGFTLAYPIWSLYVASFPAGVGQAMTAGSMLGFVLYDLTHCKYLVVELNVFLSCSNCPCLCPN